MSGVAVVTGASGGIGRAIVVELARDGADIVAIARDPNALDSLRSEVEREGRRFLGLSIDLSSPEGPTHAADQAWAWQGTLSALVNAAGTLIRKPEDEIADWERTFNVNVRAPYLLMETLGNRMYQERGGCIVNIASVAGRFVTRAPAAYQGSKAALIQLTRFFASQWAPRVRVNAVGPGYIRTGMTDDWLSVTANRRYVLTHTPLGRIGVPEDVAGPVAFLVSERAAYITGQHLLVDGGWGIA